MSFRNVFEPARVVIFDVDGTLYDGGKLRRRMALELLLSCVVAPRKLSDVRALQVYRRERERIAEEECTEILRLQYERPAALLGIAPPGLEALVDDWIHRRPLPHLPAARIVGSRRFFEQLRTSGRTIAIYSDYPASAKLEALELEADLVVAATDPGVDRLKPHPAGLTHLLEHLGEEPHACLLIGDRVSRDGAAARRAGVPFLRRSLRGEPGTFRDYLQLSKALD